MQLARLDAAAVALVLPYDLQGHNTRWGSLGSLQSEPLKAQTLSFKGGAVHNPPLYSSLARGTASQGAATTESTRQHQRSRVADVTGGRGSEGLSLLAAMVSPSACASRTLFAPSTRRAITSNGPPATMHTM